MIGGAQLADQLSPGSSRGPVYETHLLKPDIAAPGFNIHSAQAGGGSERMLSGGTSMAAPHVAGAVALLLEKHPDWSPFIIKAALMNTAVQTRDENGAPYPETRTGAGRVNPGLAIDTPIIASECGFAGESVAVVRPAGSGRAALGQAEHRVDQFGRPSVGRLHRGEQHLGQRRRDAYCGQADGYRPGQGHGHRRDDAGD